MKTLDKQQVNFGYFNPIQNNYNQERRIINYDADVFTPYLINAIESINQLHNEEDDSNTKNIMLENAILPSGKKIIIIADQGKQYTNGDNNDFQSVIMNSIKTKGSNIKSTMYKNLSMFADILIAKNIQLYARKQDDTLLKCIIDLEKMYELSSCYADINDSNLKLINDSSRIDKEVECFIKQNYSDYNFMVVLDDYQERLEDLFGVELHNNYLTRSFNNILGSNYNNNDDKYKILLKFQDGTKVKMGLYGKKPDIKKNERFSHTYRINDNLFVSISGSYHISVDGLRVQTRIDNKLPFGYRLRLNGLLVADETQIPEYLHQFKYGKALKGTKYDTTLLLRAFDVDVNIIDLQNVAKISHLDWIIMPEDEYNEVMFIIKDNIDNLANLRDAYNQYASSRKKGLKVDYVILENNLEKAFVKVLNE